MTVIKEHYDYLNMLKKCGRRNFNIDTALDKLISLAKKDLDWVHDLEMKSNDGTIPIDFLLGYIEDLEEVVKDQN